MELDLRHHSPRPIPTCRLVQKALVPHHRSVAGPSHRSSQQLPDAALQVVVGRKADGVLHLAFFQRRVEFRLGKGGGGAEDYLLALLLLPLNLGQQQFFPALGAVDVAGPQLGGEAVAFPIEQQQGMVAGGFKVAVVSALLLLAINRYFGAVHVQHYPARRIDCFRPGDQLPVERGQPGKVFLLRQHFRLKRLQARGQRRAALPYLLRADQPEGRILREPRGVVHILIPRQAAVYRLPHQVGQRQLGVLAAPGIG